MKRLVLFSSPKGKNFNEILDKIFPQEIENKVLAYMPAYEKEGKRRMYEDEWVKTAKKYNAEYQYIDILSEDAEEEKEKIRKANILIITGGNTFGLLHFIRENGILDEIKNFFEKPEFVIAGWSAGALLMSPTIEVASLPHRDGSKTPMDNNKWKLTDLTGLGFTDFEVFPHYDENLHQQTFEEYSKKKNGKVKALTDDDYIVIDL